MSYLTIGHRLPRFLASRLFGDRTRFGLSVDPADPCWKEWQQAYLDFYYNNQKRSIGAVVNNAGYRVLRTFDLTDKQVLEIGPGDIAHADCWSGVPKKFTIADI